MINGNAIQFLNSIYYEDAYLLFQNEKYFVNGCCCTFDDRHNITNVKLEVYNISRKTTVFSVEKESQAECIREFETTPIFGGRTFWQAECQIQLIDD